MTVLILADFMKVAEFIKFGFNNISFTARNKASNIALSVSLFTNFHKLRCPVVYISMYERC